MSHSPSTISYPYHYDVSTLSWLRSTQPVVVTDALSVTLPSTAATAARQDTGNTSLALIATESTLSALNGKVPALVASRIPVDPSGVTSPVSGTFWQATQPVSLASAPSTPVTGTFWQTTQPVSLASAPSTPVTGTFWQTTQPVSLASAPSTPVTGTFWQTTQPVSLASAPSTPVTGTFWQTTQPVSGTFWQTTQPVSILASSRSDTFTATGNGTAVSATTTPFRSYAIQVVGTGSTAATWDVRLEGSLDGTNYDQILAHTNVTGDGKVGFSGSLASPCTSFRSRVAGLALGAATNVVVYIVGVQ